MSTYDTPYLLTSFTKYDILETKPGSEIKYVIVTINDVEYKIIECPLSTSCEKIVELFHTVYSKEFYTIEATQLDLDTHHDLIKKLQVTNFANKHGFITSHVEDPHEAVEAFGKSLNAFDPKTSDDGLSYRDVERIMGPINGSTPINYILDDLNDDAHRKMAESIHTRNIINEKINNAFLPMSAMQMSSLGDVTDDSKNKLEQEHNKLLTLQIINNNTEFSEQYTNQHTANEYKISPDVIDKLKYNPNVTNDIKNPYDSNNHENITSHNSNTISDQNIPSDYSTFDKKTCFQARQLRDVANKSKQIVKSIIGEQPKSKVYTVKGANFEECEEYKSTTAFNYNTFDHTHVILFRNEYFESIGYIFKDYVKDVTDMIKKYFSEITISSTLLVPRELVSTIESMASKYSDIEALTTDVQRILTQYNNNSVDATFTNIKEIVINNYELNDDRSLCVQFTHIVEHVCKVGRFALEQKKIVQRILPSVLQKLGLHKKRLASGMHWYGMKLKEKADPYKIVVNTDMAFTINDIPIDTEPLTQEVISKRLKKYHDAGIMPPVKTYPNANYFNDAVLLSANDFNNDALLSDNEFTHNLDKKEQKKINELPATIFDGSMNNSKVKDISS